MILFKIHGMTLKEPALLFQATAASHPKENVVDVSKLSPEAPGRK